MGLLLLLPEASAVQAVAHDVFQRNRCSGIARHNHQSSTGKLKATRSQLQ